MNKIDMNKTEVFSVKDRVNLVRIDNIDTLEDANKVDFFNEELVILGEKIVEAINNKKPVIWFFGAHVIKSGMSRYLIDLIKKGLISHIASNGAGSIHDFELAYLGGTSEDVPTAIEDGSFGMWDETGSMMNEAIQLGYKKGLGYGESLGKYIYDNPEKFKYRNDCVLYNAYIHKVPATYHISIGTDIIHQHPSVDFSVLGGASGEDFKIFANTLKDLDGGVHLNVGSSVQGPEIFLKALSIVRNQGYIVSKITTANFDLIPLGDYKCNISKDHFHYYYRPRKNIINRPTSLGGLGLYICGNHNVTIPTLYKLILKGLNYEN